jgi:Inner membrane protein YgaP-like, transmembrane domain
VKTIYTSNPYQNVTNNERGFRSVFGMGLLTTVAAGIIASPIAIFGTSMIGVYLVMTAIIGSDPVYAVAKAVATSTYHKDLVTA